MTDYTTGQWYGYNGGGCPVHPQTFVEVSWSVSAPTAHHRPHKAGQWNWSTGQICAFRIITPHVEPAPKLECWVNVYPDGDLSLAFNSQWDADRAKTRERIRCARMIEADDQ